MTMAPIDGRQFAVACRRRTKSPAPCQFSQLLRLAVIMILAGVFVSVTLAPDRARAETAVAAPVAAL